MSKKTRVILKLSGEALSGDNGHVIDPEKVRDIAREIKEAYDIGTLEIGIIVGGGNIASEKLEHLLDFTTDIKIIAPQFTSNMKQLIYFQKALPSFFYWRRKTFR